MKIYFLCILCLFFGAGCDSHSGSHTPHASASDQNVLIALADEMGQKYLSLNRTQLELQQQPVPENTPIVSTENDSVNITTLAQSHPVIVFRYSHVSCNLCIDEITDRLNEFSQSGSGTSYPVVAIASYQSFRHFISFYRTARLRFPVYYLAEKHAKGVFDINLPPYLFLMDSSRTIRFPYAPIKEVHGSVATYLDFIRSR